MQVGGRGLFLIDSRGRLNLNSKGLLTLFKGEIKILRLALRAAITYS
jgi:hypothetical protein